VKLARRDGVPSPRARDAERSSHRPGIACNRFAVRTILLSPRCTGYQLWNKQRKSEVLINDDVALGHPSKLRPNNVGKWLDRVNPAPIPLFLTAAPPSLRSRT
jgi:site-specific DNA recombinase